MKTKRVIQTLDDASGRFVRPPDATANATDRLERDLSVQDMSERDFALNVEPDEEQDDKSVDPIDEEIAAYLDDELTDEQREAFERKLQTSPDLRVRVESQRSAWNALDLLKDEASSPDLTESTVERLNSETQSELQAFGARQKRRLFLWHGANLFVALFLLSVGYFTFSAFFPDVRTQRERDCRVVERLPQLETIGEFEYLVALNDANLFNERAEQRGAARGGNDDGASNVGKRSYAELSQDRSFYRLQRRFEQTDKPTRERWRTLYCQIDRAPNAAELWKTLDDYTNWLELATSDSDRARLASEPIVVRVEEVRKRREFFERMFSFHANRSPSRSDSPRPGQNQPPSASLIGTRSRGQDEISQATTAFRLALPEELRNENLTSIYQKYVEFRRAQGLEQNDGGQREGILEFLTNADRQELVKTLSPEAQTYMSSTSEVERDAAMGLLVSLSFWENNRSLFKRSYPQTRPNAAPSFPKRPNGQFGVPQFQRRGHDSIRELADALRKAPNDARDYVTSCPAPMARGLLLGLHWGLAPNDGTLPGRQTQQLPEFNRFGPNMPKAPEQRFTPNDRDRRPKQESDDKF